MIRGATVSKRYLGKICEKHPELGGERLRSNSACISCHNTKRHNLSKRKYWDDPTFRVAYLKRRSVLKAKWGRYALYTANYRASKRERTPAWADIDKIKAIYATAKKLGATVDHYYPLKGATVSGLHVHMNLRIISQQENDRKGNKHPHEFYGIGEWE